MSNKLYNEIDKDKAYIEFESIKLYVESFTNPNGVKHIMPIFLEEQPATWFLLQDEIKKTLYDGANVLDVGCGSGFWSLLIKKKFPYSNVYGIDKNAKAVTAAIENADNNDLSIDFGNYEMNPDFGKTHETKYDLIVLTPPYHLYPEENTKNIPFFARGGKNGQVEFYKQIDASLKLLKENGIIIFNMMCVGRNNFPNYVYHLKNKYARIDLKYFNIFPKYDTHTFLKALYPKNKYNLYVDELSKSYPELYYTSGVIKKDINFKLQEIASTFEINRSWEDRILLHKDINTF